jgi:hypothetical protein
MHQGASAGSFTRRAILLEIDGVHWCCRIKAFASAAPSPAASACTMPAATGQGHMKRPGQFGAAAPHLPCAGKLAAQHATRSVTAATAACTFSAVAARHVAVLPAAIKGLLNPGNECYINASVQLLAHIPVVQDVAALYASSETAPKGARLMTRALCAVVRDMPNKAAQPHAVVDHHTKTALKCEVCNTQGRLLTRLLAESSSMRHCASACTGIASR